MRNTKQRDLIYEVVVSSEKHLTADQIYNECIKSIPSISLGTVYRNLNSLVNSRKIKRIKMPDNIDRFDKTKKHSHIICNKCGKIDDVWYNYEIELPKLLNYDIIDYDLCFNGICKYCKEKEN